MVMGDSGWFWLGIGSSRQRKVPKEPGCLPKDLEVMWNRGLVLMKGADFSLFFWRVAESLGRIT